jgi:hypothetical protein
MRKIIYLRFEVFTAVSINITVLWDMTLYDLIEVYFTYVLEEHLFDPEHGEKMFL